MDTSKKFFESFDDVKARSRVTVKTYNQDELKQSIKEFASKLDTYQGNIDALKFALSLPKDESYKEAKVGLFNTAINNLIDTYGSRLSLPFLVGLVNENRTNKYKYVKDVVEEVGLYTMIRRAYNKKGYQEQLRHRFKRSNGFFYAIFTSTEYLEAKDRLMSWKAHCLETSIKPEALQLVFTD